MVLSRTIATLTRHGFTITHEEPRPSLANPDEMLPPSQFQAAMPGKRHVIEFLRNGRGDDLTCLRVRRLTDRDDSQSDYCAGSWCSSLKQAIRWATED